jgi:preprotein translocase subunit YajC
MIDRIFGITTAFAEQAASAAGTTAAAADGAAEQMTAGNTFVALLITFLPFVLLFGVMWFVMIRPQRKKDKQVKEMLNNLKAGDQVCTIGGIYGTIVGIKDDTVTLSVGRDNLTMVIARWGIRSVEEVTIENDAQDLN